MFAWTYIFLSISENRHDPKVLTSACGLLTNLAYDEHIAKQMIPSAVKAIVRCMYRHPFDNHLQRNAAASLSNLSATPDFISFLVEVKGIEALFCAISNHSKDGDVTQLARGALQNLSVYDETTSLHVAATFCNAMTCKQVLLKEWRDRHEGFMDVSLQDIYRDQPLHSVMRAILGMNLFEKKVEEEEGDETESEINPGSAFFEQRHASAPPPNISMALNRPPRKSERKRKMKMNLMIAKQARQGLSEKLDVIQFLVSCGASVNALNCRNEDPFGLIDKCTSLDLNEKRNLSKFVNIAIHGGQRHVHVVQKKLCLFLMGIREELPKEMAKTISMYVHPLEISILFRIELEPTFQLAHLQTIFDQFEMNEGGFDLAHQGPRITEVDN